MINTTLPFYKRLVFQVMVWFSLISLIPLALATYLNFTYAAQVLDDTTSVNLYSIAQHQSKSIKDFIKATQKDTLLLAETPTVIDALNAMHCLSEHPFGVDQKENLANHIKDQHLRVLKRFLEKLSIENIFLVTPNGKLAYNVQAKTLQHLFHKSHPLSMSFEHTIMVMSPQISDFSIDNSTQTPSLFFTSPVFHKKILIGVLAIQASPSSIYDMVNNYTGLDQTGETVITQYKNNSAILLNPTRNAPHLAFREDIFSNAPNSAISKALSGERGFGQAIDYLGQPVLAAWEYLPSLRWGLVVKKDLSEVFSPIVKLKRISLSVGGITLLIVLLTAMLASENITRPIIALTQAATRIARGDLSSCAGDPTPSNEIGILAQAVYTMSDNLKRLIDKVKESSQDILSIYSATFKSSQTQSNAALRTATAFNQITNLSEGMANTSKDLLEIIQSIKQTTQKTALQAEFSRNRLRIIESTIQEIVGAKDAISDQFLLIQEKANAIFSIFESTIKIADRTNILALNTAIEAHYVGGSSLGFRVVAREIKQLSDQTDLSCLRIEQTIQEMNKAIQAGTSCIQQFSQTVTEEFKEVSSTNIHINKLIEDIAELPHPLESAFKRMESQLENAEKIAQTIRSIRNSVQQTVSILDEAHTSLHHLQRSSSTFQKEIAQFKT